MREAKVQEIKILPHSQVTDQVKKKKALVNIISLHTVIYVSDTTLLGIKKKNLWHFYFSSAEEQCLQYFIIK